MFDVLTGRTISPTRVLAPFPRRRKSTVVRGWELMTAVLIVRRLEDRSTPFSPCLLRHRRSRFGAGEPVSDVESGGSCNVLEGETEGRRTT
jgi:hypothetical protein